MQIYVEEFNGNLAKRHFFLNQMVQERSLKITVKKALDNLLVYQVSNTMNTSDVCT